MSSPYFLQQLAQTAEIHAANTFSQRLPLTIRAVDALLDQLRSSPEPVDDNIIACYGAWFGEQLLACIEGAWVGLHEPVPPRVAVGGLLVSPMDAISRRLASEHEATLEDLIARLPESKAQDWRTTNERAWDRLADEDRFQMPALPTDREQAAATLDPWLSAEGVEGKEVLCLAAGGGTHGPLLALAGGVVTIVDVSRRALEFDRHWAQTQQAELRTINGSMEDLPMLADAIFDVVVQPVSLCYVEEPRRVYEELARVLKPGGLYVSQQKCPASLQASEAETSGGYRVNQAVRRGTALPPATSQQTQREPSTIEYAHSLEDLIGGLCRCGFVVEDLAQPMRADAWAPPNSPAHRAWFFPPYIKLKARRM